MASGMMTGVIIIWLVDVVSLKHERPSEESISFPPIRAKIGDVFDGFGVSTFLNAGLMLNDIGISRITGGSGRYTVFEMIVDGDKASNFVFQKIMKNNSFKTFEYILENFIGITTHFGHIEEKRIFFRPKNYLNIMKLLSKIGIVGRVDDLYRWNDAMTPIMHNLLLWNEDGKSYKELEEENINEYASEFINSIPHKELSRLNDVDSALGMAGFLFRHWDYYKLYFPDNEELSSEGFWIRAYGRSLAEAIFKKINRIV